MNDSPRLLSEIKIEIHYSQIKKLLLHTRGIKLKKCIYEYMDNTKSRLPYNFNACKCLKWHFDQIDKTMQQNRNSCCCRQEKLLTHGKLQSLPTVAILFLISDRISRGFVKLFAMLSRNNSFCVVTIEPIPRW